MPHDMFDSFQAATPPPFKSEHEKTPVSRQLHTLIQGQTQQPDLHNLAGQQKHRPAPLQISAIYDRPLFFIDHNGHCQSLYSPATPTCGPPPSSAVSAFSSNPSDGPDLHDSPTVSSFDLTSHLFTLATMPTSGSATPVDTSPPIPNVHNPFWATSSPPVITGSNLLTTIPKDLQFISLTPDSVIPTPSMQGIAVPPISSVTVGGEGSAYKFNELLAPDFPLSMIPACPENTLSIPCNDRVGPNALPTFASSLQIATTLFHPDFLAALSTPVCPMPTLTYALNASGSVRPEATASGSASPMDSLFSSAWSSSSRPFPTLSSQSNSLAQCDDTTTSPSQLPTPGNSCATSTTTSSASSPRVTTTVISLPNGPTVTSDTCTQQSRPRRTKWESLADGGGPQFRMRTLPETTRVFQQLPESSFGGAANNSQVIDYDIRVLARMDKGFHRVQGLATAYKRNQTEIFACFSATPAQVHAGDEYSVIAPFSLPCMVQIGSGPATECSLFMIQSRAVRTGTHLPIDLLQATRSRTRGSMMLVKPLPCEANGWLDVPSIEYLPRRVHFAGVMFSSATPDTAGSGKKTKKQRKNPGTKAPAVVEAPLPATFTVIVDLIACAASGEQIGVVASCESDPIVIRSRPPAHYANEDSCASRCN